MSNKSRAYNIAIIPPKKISDKAIRISRFLKKFGVFFTLDGKNYFPHMTVYMVEFPNKNLEQVKEVLEQISKKIKNFKVQSLTYKHIAYGHSGGWVHVDFKNTPPLMKLQKEIIFSANKLRGGLLMNDDKARISSAPDQMKKNLKTYGYSNAFYKFSAPHITFTRLKKPDSKSLAEIKKYNFSFEVTKFGLFEKGKHGTCRKLVKEFKLK